MDVNLFLWLNHDCGPVMDRIMVTISGTWMWIPFHLLALGLIWRKASRQGGVNPWTVLLLFLAAAAIALGLSDMVCGIFKHNGVVGSWFQPFPARLRPMYTPELEGLVHRVHLGGTYGTVSGHAATIVSVVTLSALVIRRWWYTLLGAVVALLIIYSRIYLGYHFPLDLLYGTLTGLLAGFIAYLVYRKLITFVVNKKRKNASTPQ